MPKIYKNTIKAVVKRFDLGVLIFYCCCLISLYLAILISQNDQAQAIFAKPTENYYPHALIEIKVLPSQQVLYSKNAHAPIALRRIDNSELQLLFTHPVLLLLTAWYFAVFNVLFGLSALVVRLIIVKAIEQHFIPIRELENWALLSKVHGRFMPIKSTDLISESIATILHNLHETKNNQGLAEQKIRERLLLEPETGVGNREFFTNRLEAFLKEEDAHGAVLLICFKDYDILQSTYGNRQSIEMIESAIQVVKKRLAHFNHYFLARPADSELVILLPNVYLNDLKKLADKLCQSLQNITLPIGINREEFVHIGIVNFVEEQQAYKIMAEADMALRNAQLQGPSQWFMYELGEVVQDTAKGSLAWRTFLTSALDKNAFVIFFQPVIASHTNMIIHHEVLSKVRDNQRKLISARVFLPMAQKCGLSTAVDKLVLTQVCRLLQYERTAHGACSLNLSIDALLDDNFIEFMFSKLAEMPEVAQRLIIEISEYYLVSQLSKLRPVIQLLDELGIKILADKVGQYIGSTDYLSCCPIHYIKLHRSIVYQIHQKIENQVFVQSLKTRCHQQGINIYALGVENAEEWRVLVDLGVSGGQGHFFTEPAAQMANAIEVH